MATSLTGECESSDQVVNYKDYNMQTASELAMVLCPRPRKTLNISEKVELIRLIDSAPQMKKKDIAAMYGIPINTLSTIYSKREKFLHHSDFSNCNKMRIRASTFPEIEAELLKWYIETYRNNPGQRPPCHLLRLQALQIAHSLGIDNFSASNGWIERFKVRHNLKLHHYRTRKKSMPAACTPNDVLRDVNRSDGAINGNSSGLGSSYISDSNNFQCDLNPDVEMMAVKQEPSHSDSLYEKKTNFESTPSHIVPDQHVENNVQSYEVERHDVTPSVSYLEEKAGSSEVTIKELEEAYGVIHRYIINRRKCHVPEKTLEAVQEIKEFIMSEKDKMTQLKITDFFSHE